MSIFDPSLRAGASRVYLDNAAIPVVRIKGGCAHVLLQGLQLERSSRVHDREQ